MAEAVVEGRRERSKGARKTRIVEAARQLIEEGDVGFHVRTLARRAGLSVMTLYNLVGSQQDILLEILIEDMVATTREREALGFGDPLDEIFGMIPFIRSAFSTPFRYRRDIVLSLFRNGAERVRAEVRDIYMTRWRDILETAKAQKLIQSSADIPTLLILLDNVYTANIFSLSVGDIDEEVFEARAQFGFALALSTVVSRAQAHRVRAVLDASRTRCRELEPAGPFTRHELPVPDDKQDGEGGAGQSAAPAPIAR